MINLAILQDGLRAVLAHEAAVGEVVPLQGLGELDDPGQQGGAVGALAKEEHGVNLILS